MEELKETGDVIRPKILFTPDNSLTWKIIKRVSYLVSYNGDNCFRAAGLICTLIVLKVSCGNL